MNMSRRDTEKELERPHYFSQYWINIARQYALGGASALETMPALDEDEEELQPLPLPLRPTPKAAAPLTALSADLEDLPVPRAPTKPAKQRPLEQKPAALTSFADLATLGFGEGLDVDELAVGADADDDEVISRIGSNFDDEVEPDQEEAASLETLSEEENLFDEEEEDVDDFGAPRRAKQVKPVRPPRRPEPRF